MGNIKQWMTNIYVVSLSLEIGQYNLDKKFKGLVCVTLNNGGPMCYISISLNWITVQYR